MVPAFVPRRRPDVLHAPFVERLFSPVYRFSRVSSSSGIVLLAAAVAALVWANSPWAHAYHVLWETPLGIQFGGRSVTTTLHHLVNDGLMAVFFFLVGLEIKREMIAGELSTLKSAALPMIAALGGMVIPALIYAAINGGGPTARGWGVPMATDIAFALGVLALLGDKVPNGLKVFLAALAIVDDIGAVLVIAVFYSGGLQWAALGAATVIVLLAALANVAGVRNTWAYGALGLALWIAIAMSGIHATVAGVLLAMTIPVRIRIDETMFLGRARTAIADFEAAAARTANDPETSVLSNAEHHASLHHLEDLADKAQPPLIRIEHALHGVVGFLIMPVFAFANAGVSVSTETARTAFGSPVALGVMFGLLLGKPLGIVGFSWLAVRTRVAALPSGTSWTLITGAGLLGGIGFTMALFIAGLAFEAPAALDIAKLGIFTASAIAGVLGWLLLRWSLSQRTAGTPAPR